jgi:hypothetical protein
MTLLVVAAWAGEELTLLVPTKMVLYRNKTVL